MFCSSTLWSESRNGLRIIVRTSGHHNPNCFWKSRGFCSKLIQWELLSGESTNGQLLLAVPVTSHWTLLDDWKCERSCSDSNRKDSYTITDVTPLVKNVDVFAFKNLLGSDNDNNKYQRRDLKCTQETVTSSFLWPL